MCNRFSYSCAMSNERESAGGVQSVDRAISVLEILAQRGEAGVSEVAADIGVHKSTAFRLLAALEERELVEQTQERGKYRLGFGILRLAGAVTGRIDITQQGRPICERLAAEIGETINIAVMQEHYAINLYQVRGQSAVTAHNWVGQLTPLHATSSGKVLLAALPVEERSRILQKVGLPARTPRTITDRDTLEKQLLDVSHNGYAVVHEEFEIGLTAVAVPVYNHFGTVIGSVSISGPAFRFDPENTPGLIEGLKEAGLTISGKMGYTHR